MTDQFMTPPGAVQVTAARRLLGLAGGIIASLVGLIALIVGVVLITSQNWPVAAGTIQSCTDTVIHPNSSPQHHRKCVVTWPADGRQHTSTVDFGSAPKMPTSPVALRVHGDQARVQTPGWVGYVTALVGVLLLGGGAFVLLRRRRR